MKKSSTQFITEKNDYSDRYVFISYAREDHGIAKFLQKWLEAYHYPAKLISNAENMPPHPKFLRRIFMDTSDLSVKGDNFEAEIRQELKASRYLLVLCSEYSAASPWVAKEITAFIETHSESEILPIALDGCATANIPEPLQKILAYRNIPLWERTKKSNHAANETALFKIVEFLLKVDAHLLNNRYTIARRKRMFNISAALITGLSLISALLMYGIDQSMQAARESQQRAKAEKIAADEAKERAMFEKEVFPYSLVYSYCESYCKYFLFKLSSISQGKVKAVCMPPLSHDASQEERNAALKDAYLLNPAEHCVLILAMPKNYDELSNQEGKKKIAVAEDAKKYGWTLEPKGFNFLENKSRPITTILLNHQASGIISTEPNYTKVRVFADMASTVNSIQAVVDYLKAGDFYKNTSHEDLAHQYIATFKDCVLEEFAKTNPKHKQVFKDTSLHHIGDKTTIYFVDDEESLGHVLNEIVNTYGEP